MRGGQQNRGVGAAGAWISTHERPRALDVAGRPAGPNRRDAGRGKPAVVRWPLSVLPAEARRRHQDRRGRQGASRPTVGVRTLPRPDSSGRSSRYPDPCHRVHRSVRSSPNARGRRREDGCRGVGLPVPKRPAGVSEGKARKAKTPRPPLRRPMMQRPIMHRRMMRRETVRCRRKSDRVQIRRGLHRKVHPWSPESRAFAPGTGGCSAKIPGAPDRGSGRWETARTQADPPLPRQ